MGRHTSFNIHIIKSSRHHNQQSQYISHGVFTPGQQRILVNILTGKVEAKRIRNFTFNVGTLPSNSGVDTTKKELDRVFSGRPKVEDFSLSEIDLDRSKANPNYAPPCLHILN